MYQDVGHSPFGELDLRETNWSQVKSKTAPRIHVKGQEPIDVEVVATANIWILPNIQFFQTVKFTPKHLAKITKRKELCISCNMSVLSFT